MPLLHHREWPGYDGIGSARGEIVGVSCPNQPAVFVDYDGLGFNLPMIHLRVSPTWNDLHVEPDFEVTIPLEISGRNPCSVMHRAVWDHYFGWAGLPHIADLNDKPRLDFQGVVAYPVDVMLRVPVEEAAIGILTLYIVEQGLPDTTGFVGLDFLSRVNVLLTPTHTYVDIRRPTIPDDVLWPKDPWDSKR